MRKVIVIGGGASGLFAAYAAADAGNKVLLLEKNEKLGKKLYITGKGRCNLTNYSDNQEFLKNIVRNSKFMYASINAMSAESTMNFFKNNGLRLIVERGNRVFPESRKASDVTKILEKACLRKGVEIFLNTKVSDLIINDNCVGGVKTENKILSCDSVIICTGGKSYPLTGSDGDGYCFAKKSGHSIVPTVPALCGIEIKENFCEKLQGLSLKNVSLRENL